MASVLYCPEEVQHAIFSHFSIDEVKRARLVSQAFARLGREHLLRPTFRLHSGRQDMNRLMDIVTYPDMAKRVLELHFFVGRFDFYQTRHNIYYQYWMLTPEGRITRVHNALEELQLFVQRVGDLASTYQSEGLVRQAVRKLPNLCGIKFDLTTCPIAKSEDWQSTWDIMSTRLYDRASEMDRVSFMLTIMRESGRELRSFSHDRLPYEFWNHCSRYPGGFARCRALSPVTFRHLRVLSIRMDLDGGVNSGYEHGEWTAVWQNLMGCLSSTRSLRELHIDFLRRKGDDAKQPMLELSSNLWFPRLRKLHFEGFRTKFEGLIGFINSHRYSLKHLAMGTEVIGHKRYSRRMVAPPPLPTYIQDGWTNDPFSDPPNIPVSLDTTMRDVYYAILQSMDLESYDPMPSSPLRWDHIQHDAMKALVVELWETWAGHVEDFVLGRRGEISRVGCSGLLDGEPYEWEIVGENYG